MSTPAAICDSHPSIQKRNDNDENIDSLGSKKRKSSKQGARSDASSYSNAKIDAMPDIVQEVEPFGFNW